MGDEPTFSEVWSRFHEKLLSEIDENMVHSRRFYVNISEKWRTFSSALGTTISAYLKENREGANELYNLWKNYQNKMNAKLQRAHETGTQRYRGLLKDWSESSTQMTSLIGNRIQEEGLSNEVYLAWTDLTTSMTKWINDAVAECNNEYKDLTKTWFEFLDKMKEGISNIDQSNPNGREIFTNVREMCTAMGYEISNYITMCSKSAVNFQKDWMNMLTSTRRVFSKFFPDINYEELYTGFFDRSAWGAHGAFAAPMKVKKLEEELSDLRAKVKGLEEKLGKAT